MFFLQPFCTLSILCLADIGASSCMPEYACDLVASSRSHARPCKWTTPRACISSLYTQCKTLFGMAGSLVTAAKAWRFHLELSPILPHKRPWKTWMRTCAYNMVGSPVSRSSSCMGCSTGNSSGVKSSTENVTKRLGRLCRTRHTACSSAVLSLQ